MFATHLDAENRYSNFRKAALQVTIDTLKSEKITNIQVTLVNGEVLNATKLWKKSKVRQVDWDWIEGYNAFKFRYPKRFEIALWNKKQLIGLSLGRPTYQGTALRLDVVEASPSDLGERPNIFETILLGYGVYARLINAKEIRIMHPINDIVKSYYESFGYKYVAKGDFLYKRVY